RCTDVASRQVRRRDQQGDRCGEPTQQRDAERRSEQRECDGTADRARVLEGELAPQRLQRLLDQGASSAGRAGPARKRMAVAVENVGAAEVLERVAPGVDEAAERPDGVEQPGDGGV